MALSAWCASVRWRTVNYFEFHIGDYQRKTAHLSLAEHGAYSLMLQTFYQSERPLPAQRRVLYRLLRADSAAERKAIDAIASQYWEETDAGLVNARALEVLEEYKRWVSTQKANGRRGGRPKETHGLTDGLANGSANGNHSDSHELTQIEADGGDRVFSHLDSPSRPPIKTSHTPPGPPHQKAAPSGSRRVRGETETDSGWTPPTEEQIRAGY